MQKDIEWWAAVGRGRDGSVTSLTLREALERAGVSGQAADLVMKATARARHEWRVRQTIAEVKGLPPPSKLATLLADAIGLGTSRRHPLLRGLGKGRRWASDGPAYMAAAREAYCRLAAPDWGLVVEAGSLGEVVARQGDEATPVAEPWARLALARAGLLAALGLPCLPEGEDVSWAGFEWRGSAPDWGLAVNQAEAAYSLSSAEEAAASW